MNIKTLRMIGAFLLVGCSHEVVWSQPRTRQQIPGAVISVDFTDANKTPRKRLTEAGLSWQLPVKFSMLRESVTLAVNTPEGGQVDLVTDTDDALIEVEKTREGPTSVNLAVRSTLGRMSVEALQEQVRARIREELAEEFAQATTEAQARGPNEFRRYLRMLGEFPPTAQAELSQAYVDRRGIELGKDLLRARLEKLVLKRPRWVSQSRQASWLKASDESLHEEYVRLLELDIAEEHLRKCGFELGGASRNFEKLIASRFTAVHAIATGANASSNPEIAQAIRSITREEQARLTQALTVQGVCQFVPQTDEDDDNSQWFNGQRVGTSIATVPAVRVIGRLDAAGGDRTDWWTLLNYDEDKTRLQFADQKGLRYEVYQSPRKQTCLRVIATRDEAFAYSFDLLKRSSGGEGQAVVIHESPGNSDAKFPF